ncbi:MAG: AraC family transcriptional regulator [Chitinophaga rupis]
MILQLRQPDFPLNKYVELFTYYEARSEQHSIERLLPDGSVNLLIDLTTTPKYLFDPVTFEEKQKCERAWVSGMHSQFICISAAKEACMLVIRFRPGGSYPFLQVPLNELNDRVIDAEVLFGEKILFLREQLALTSSIREKFILTENWLLSVANFNQPIEAIISFAVARITQSPTLLSLEDIAAKSGYSQKQFIHIFKTHLGQTPKVYQRITRFNRVLQEIEKTQSVHWTRLCLDLGYYDQAHFIREFQEFAGFNPKDFLKQRGEYIHYVPVR